MNSLTSSSLTPMHYAAISGKPEVAELLESSGADVMPRDNVSVTYFFKILLFMFLKLLFNALTKKKHNY